MGDDLDFTSDDPADDGLSGDDEERLTGALAALGVDPARLTRADLVAVVRALAADAPEEIEAIRMTGAPADPVRFGSYVPGYLSRADSVLDSCEGIVRIDPFAPGFGKR